MAQSKFDKILKKAINKNNNDFKESISIEDLETHSKIVSQLEQLSFCKNNSCTINLPDSFKTNEAIARYYHKTTHNGLKSTINNLI